MTIKHQGDVMFAASASVGTFSWLGSLDMIVSIAVGIVAIVAGIYSILWNRLRIINERKKLDDNQS